MVITRKMYEDYPLEVAALVAARKTIHDLEREFGQETPLTEQLTRLADEREKQLTS